MNTTSRTVKGSKNKRAFIGGAFSPLFLAALLLLFLLFLLGDDSARHTQPVVLLEVLVRQFVPPDVEVRVRLAQLVQLIVLDNRGARNVQKGHICAVLEEALDAELADAFAFGDLHVLQVWHRLGDQGEGRVADART